MLVLRNMKNTGYKFIKGNIAWKKKLDNFYAKSLPNN